MRTYIRRREKNKQLVVFFGGWGTDENVFAPLCNDEFDFILFYNYSADDPLVLPEMKTYEKVTLIGWSLGVWASEYLLPKTGIRPDITIAVNGTPLPADDNFGIPLNIIEGTLNNLNEENISKFYLRMFGGKSAFLANADRMPKRTLKSLHDELRWLYNRMMEMSEPGFKWDYAVTSAADRVYPSKNLVAYWSTRKETNHVVLPLPHYFFHKWSTLSDFIGFVENYNAQTDRQKRTALRAIKGL